MRLSLFPLTLPLHTWMARLSARKLAELGAQACLHARVPRELPERVGERLRGGFGAGHAVGCVNRRGNAQPEIAYIKMTTCEGVGMRSEGSGRCGGVRGPSAPRLRSRPSRAASSAASACPHLHRDPCRRHRRQGQRRAAAPSSPRSAGGS